MTEIPTKATGKTTLGLAITSFMEDWTFEDSMDLAMAVAVDCSDAEEVKALEEEEEDVVCSLLSATLSVTVCGVHKFFERLL